MKCWVCDKEYEGEKCPFCGAPSELPGALPPSIPDKQEEKEPEKKKKFKII